MLEKMSSFKGIYTKMISKFQRYRNPPPLNLIYICTYAFDLVLVLKYLSASQVAVLKS